MEVPDNPRPPTTLRITRPWGSEKEFVEQDIACLGRTAILLPGAPPRETGELIRFEIVLSTGTPVFRGEGTVVAHHPPGGSKPAGLEVRFTRIDARSKLILDRVREKRTTLTRQGSIPPPAHVSQAPGPQIMSMPAPPGSVISMPAVTVPVARRVGARGPVPPPPNRDDILARLRERAQKLDSQGGFEFKKR